MVSTNNENRVSISYVGDLSSEPPDDAFVVESDHDYVLACYKLSQSLMANAPVSIWVRTKNHFAWLSDFTEQIDCPALVEEKTSRLVLAELWNVTVPEWLTDAEILGNKLLEMSVDSRSRTLFEYRFLIHVLGTAFQPDILIADHLVEVIRSLLSEDADKASERYPILHRCLLAKCQQWATTSTEAWIEDICKQLADNPAQLWKWLSLWSGLHSYPDRLLEFVLTPEQIHVVQKVPPKAVEALPLERTAAEQIETQIETFFKETSNQVNSSAEFVKILGFTSGKLVQEYRFITRVLHGNQFSPCREDIQKVYAKFRACPGVSETQLRSLIHLVKPEYPNPVDQERGRAASDWITWAVREYIPYRTWQLHSRYYDADVEQTIEDFSDWYVQEYASIHQNPDLSLIHCLRDISTDSRALEFTLILLIDCLPLNYIDLLDGIFRAFGFSQHGLSYRFAILPTTTECNKARLLSGDWLVQTGSYEDIIKARSLVDWNNRTTAYHSDLKSLSDMTIPCESAVAVINYIDVDEVLHSDVESKNTTYEDELDRLFKRVAQSVQQLCQEWNGPREHFKVYVVTDHGACRILEEEKRSFDSEIVNKLFANEKHRYAAVPEDQLDIVPDNLWDFGYRFKQPFASEDISYFLPKGHNTVRQAMITKGHMHGGVTPEEVIVPMALYKPVKVARKTPTVRFLNLDKVQETGIAKFYIQRVVTIEIEIQNPNTTAISIIRASVVSPEADLKSCETPKIEAGSTTTMKMGCYFTKAALEKHSLEIEIAYEIAGESRVFPMTLASEFKSALSRGFNLKDL